MTNEFQQGPDRNPDTTSGGGITYPKPLSELTYLDAVASAAALVVTIYELNPEILTTIFPGTEDLFETLIGLIRGGPLA